MVFWLQLSRDIRLFAAPFPTVSEETGFSRWSLSSAVIFRALFLWSFLTIRLSVWRSLSDSFRFLPEFCFSERFFFLSQLLSLLSRQYTKEFRSFCYTSACHTSTNNLTSFKVLQICHFNEFWLISYDDISKKATILVKQDDKSNNK